MTLDDIATANRIAGEILGRTLDDLPPQTRRLLLLIEEFVGREGQRLKLARADFRFTRRDVRAHTGWGNTQLKLHLSRLEEMEYVLAHRGRTRPELCLRTALRRPGPGRKAVPHRPPGR